MYQVINIRTLLALSQLLLVIEDSISITSAIAKALIGVSSDYVCMYACMYVCMRMTVFVHHAVTTAGDQFVSQFDLMESQQGSSISLCSGSIVSVFGHTG